MRPCRASFSAFYRDPQSLFQIVILLDSRSIWLPNRAAYASCYRLLPANNGLVGANARLVAANHCLVGPNER